jgi:hypothetical protein
MTNLIIREFNGKKIRHREDGFMSLTDLCQATGKQISDWYRLDSTKEYLKVLAGHLGKEVNEIIEINQGGIPTEQGTWGDRRVAIRLAQWLSPQLAVQIDEWVIEYLTKQHRWEQKLEQSFLESLTTSTSKEGKAGFVYAVLDQGNDRVKIGMTANPIQRLRQLQAGDRTTLEFYGLRAVESVGLARLHERYLHDLFSGDRICGEWFGAGLMVDARFTDYFSGSDDFTISYQDLIPSELLG